MGAPGDRYRGDRTDCRVQGCSADSTVVVGTRIEFPAADGEGSERVNVTITCCRGHSADLLRALRDRKATVRIRSLSESNVRHFAPYLNGGGPMTPSIPCPRCGAHGLPTCHICKGSGVASWSSTPEPRAPRYPGDDVSQPIPEPRLVDELGGLRRPPAPAGSNVVPIAGRPRARSTDPETSHAAAASISTEQQVTLRDRVLQLLRELGPLHDYALIEAYGRVQVERGWGPATRSGIQTRRHELTVTGDVVDTEDRVLLETGRRAIVWRAV